MIILEDTIQIPNFDMDDFNCPCCGQNKMLDRTILMLQWARTEARIPFIITSGYRCEKHNKEIGGVTGSEHVRGEAVDILCNSSTARFKIVDCGLKAGFRRIGLYKNRDCVHLGCSWKKIQQVLWLE
jgi:uncharacterized protein YcbK (DUF882 family)